MTRQHHRPGWAIWLGLITIALVTAIMWWRPWESAAGPAPAEAEPVTAVVERTTLTSQLRLTAQLSYGDAVPLPDAGGTITALPGAGTVIRAGHQVYEADGRPVVLFRGARPFWRQLSAGMADGEDVRQLQQNLVTLGFLTGRPDGNFGGRTRAAVRAWQASLGVPRTGVFSPSDVVVAQGLGIRIAQVTARLGSANASPATYTETTLRATARLTDAQARELAAGTPVTVVLPDATEVASALSAVDPGGQPTGDADTTTAPSATIAFDDQTAVAKAGPVAVRVVIRGGARQPETLVVPVTALLATPDGRYAVEVPAEPEPTRIPVEIGLVSDARVQILRSGSQVDRGTGPTLQPGDKVVLAR